MRHFVLTTILSLVTLVAAPAAMAGAGGSPPPAYFVDESKLPFTALPGATAYWGVHTGAGFRAEVPANWNGSLVVWATASGAPVSSSPSTTIPCAPC